MQLWQMGKIRSESEEYLNQGTNKSDYEQKHNKHKIPLGSDVAHSRNAQVASILALRKPNYYLEARKRIFSKGHINQSPRNSRTKERDMMVCRMLSKLETKNKLHHGWLALPKTE